MRRLVAFSSKEFSQIIIFCVYHDFLVVNNSLKDADLKYIHKYSNILVTVKHITILQTVSVIYKSVGYVKQNS